VTDDTRIARLEARVRELETEVQSLDPGWAGPPMPAVNHCDRCGAPLARPNAIQRVYRALVGELCAGCDAEVERELLATGKGKP
jgi:hypothetical protein